MLENLGILQDTDTLSDRYDNSCPCSGSALAVYMVTWSQYQEYQTQLTVNYIIIKC